MFLNRFASASKYSLSVIRLHVRNTHRGNQCNHPVIGIPLWKIQSRADGISVALSREKPTVFCCGNQRLNYYCTTSDKPLSPDKPLSSREKLKQAVKDYGSTILVFHIAISLASLGCFYVAVCSGVNVNDLLEKLNIKSSQNVTNVASGVGTFAIAYAVHKMFAPVRIGITLTAAPVLVRYLRRVGVLKTTPKK